MSIQNLSPEKMIEHTRRWTTATEPAGKILTEISAVAPALEELRAVQTQLTAPQQESAPAVSAEEQALTEALATFDDGFDHRVRGIHWIIKGLAELAQTAEMSQQLTDLNNKLFPKGLDTTQLSYRDEAGVGPILSQQLANPQTQATLRGVTLPDSAKTLADICDEVVTLAQQLGSADAQREQLRQQRAPKAPAPAATPDAAPPALSQIKRRWVRAVKLLRQLVALSKLPTQTVDLLFLTLDQDIAAATKNKT
jgi:hypothetical protein